MVMGFWSIGFFILLVLLVLSIGMALSLRRRAVYGLTERASFFRSTTDLIIILDDSLVVKEFNRAARIKLRLEKGEAIGQKVEETAIWPESFGDRHRAMKALQAALDGETALFTFNLSDPRGNPAELEVRAYPMTSPTTGLKEIICYGRDISVEHGSRQRLKRRTEVEDIIARMMEATFAEGDSRKRIPGILEMSGEFLGARRAFLFQTDTSGSISWNHLWSAPGIPFLEDGTWNGMNAQTMMPFPVHQGVKIFRNLPENPEMPEDFRTAAREAGMGSLVILNLSLRNGQTFGYSGFSFNEIQPPEDGSALILLKLFGATMTGLLSRVDDQRNIKLFRESVDAAGQGIALISGEGNVIYANTTYGTLTGLVPDSPTPVWEHYHGDFAGKVQNLILPMVASGKRWNGELQILDAEGGTVDTIETFVPVDTIPGDTDYIINMITDISDRKKLEAQLIKARKDAEFANRAKSDYLANMSHEIRTPMNAVIGLAFLALQTELDSRQRDYIAKINTAAKGLLNIINDILDLSKIEAGRLELELAPFSLDEVLESAVDMAAETARAKGLRLLYRRPPELPDRWIGDRFRLGQVLLNLVGNAVKFTSEGRVTVSVRSDVPGFLRFTVEDSGIGMTEEQMARLFKPFQQAEASTSREFGGTGLGLTISRQIVELMSGTISVSSIPDEGSAFEFTVAMNRDRSGIQETDSVKRGSSGTAAVISSDPMNREFHYNVLTTIGYETSTFGSIKEVLENPVFPNLLVLDLDDCCKNPKAAAYALSDGADENFTLMLSGSRNEEELVAFVPEGVRHIILPVPYGKNRLKDALAELDENSDTVSESRSSHSSSAISARILLVDDNAINRQVGGELLSSAGLSVDLAVDGKEAVRMCKETDYNLIFMDLHMPEMDGYEATKIIRDSRPEVPIIAMTASTLHDVKTEILDAGFSGYMAKPIDPDKVFQVLGKELNIPEGLFRTALQERYRPDKKRQSIEGIDESRLLTQLLGDRDKFDMLLKLFADEHAGDASRIRKGPGDSQNEFVALLHYLRGSAGLIGATGIRKESGKLEDTIRRGETVEPEAYESLAEELSKLITRISGNTQQKKIDAGLMDELENLIRNSDDSAGRYLEEKITVSADPSMEPYIEKIRIALSRWDYDEALNALDDCRVNSPGTPE